jgi:hypothetical protein
MTPEEVVEYRRNELDVKTTICVIVIIVNDPDRAR